MVVYRMGKVGWGITVDGTIDNDNGGLKQDGGIYNKSGMDGQAKIASGLEDGRESVGVFKTRTKFQMS